MLVVHAGRFRAPKKWGLPGGHVEKNEDGVETVRRELREELYIFDQDVAVDDYKLLGDYYYKRHQHRIYGADIAEPIAKFDRRELVKVAWFPVSSIEKLASDGNLHAGYEAEAVMQYQAMSNDRS